jgi:ribonuclease HII
MGLLVGMDEAGYGPNFGPLVVSAVAWEVPGDPRTIDLWREFAAVAAQAVPKDGSHLQVADSKAVYSPARGLEQLERSVLSSLYVQRGCAVLKADRAVSHDTGRAVPQGYRELCHRVSLAPAGDLDSEPWFAGADLPIPVGAAAGGDAGVFADLRLAEAWLELCLSRGIRLRAMCADIVLTRRFNEQTARLDSKGMALSEISMNVLRNVLAQCADADGPVLIHADKHGGRNRYHEFLPIAFDDAFVCCLRESAECSAYRVDRAEIRFETKSERYLPVALASMLSKYVRELSMLLFNQFWCARIPGLQPTAGYPGDAQRYRESIAPVQRELGISDADLWRNR